MRRKWRAVRNSLVAIAVAAFCAAGFLLLHAWTYSDASGDSGTCASVWTGSAGDTLTNLEVPEFPAARLCAHQRSTHGREAIGAVVFGTVVLGLAVWAHRQPDHRRWSTVAGSSSQPA